MLHAIAVVTTVVTLLLPVPQTAPAPLAGTWRGMVKAEMGEMPITVKVSVTKDVASGSIETSHGTFTIAKGTFASGKWTLPFEADGVKGRMVGVIKGDTFSGDWTFMSPGTFSLERQK